MVGTGKGLDLKDKGGVVLGEGEVFFTWIVILRVWLVGYFNVSGG